MPGDYATPENIAKVDLSRAPEGLPLRELLTETHRELYQPRGPKR
ncbi:MAG TPA: hypothetical protein VHW01_09260 [Polyangiaceae bacterium]|nr:hypothetical protein [Polyangiaceae bacterium]